MRTYDKLIAAIHTGQGIGGLRPSSGIVPARVLSVAVEVRAILQESS